MDMDAMMAAALTNAALAARVQKLADALAPGDQKAQLEKACSRLLTLRPPLTLGEAGLLGDLLRATWGDRKVGRLVEDTVVTGEARSFGDQNGNSDFTSDVRDQYLRVTLDNGFDMFWKVSELLPEVSTGEFVVGYEPSKSLSDSAVSAGQGM